MSVKRKRCREKPPVRWILYDYSTKLMVLTVICMCVSLFSVMMIVCDLLTVEWMTAARC